MTAEVGNFKLSVHASQDQLKPGVGNLKLSVHASQDQLNPGVGNFKLSVPASHRSQASQQSRSGACGGWQARFSTREEESGDGEGRGHHVEVEDELGQVLDGVDVMVGWRGNERHPRLALPQVGDVRAHLLAR